MILLIEFSKKRNSMEVGSFGSFFFGDNYNVPFDQNILIYRSTFSTSVHFGASVESQLTSYAKLHST